jgi:hypothetical protein
VLTVVSLVTLPATVRKNRLGFLPVFVAVMTPMALRLRQEPLPGMTGVFPLRLQVLVTNGFSEMPLSSQKPTAK